MWLGWLFFFLLFLQCVALDGSFGFSRWVFRVFFHGYFPTNTPRGFHVETIWNPRGVFVGFFYNRLEDDEFSDTYKLKPFINFQNNETSTSFSIEDFAGVIKKFEAHYIQLFCVFNFEFY